MATGTHPPRPWSLSSQCQGQSWGQGSVPGETQPETMVPGSQPSMGWVPAKGVLDGGTLLRLPDQAGNSESVLLGTPRGSESLPWPGHRCAYH